MSCAHRGECDPVGDLMFRQEYAPQTFQSVLEISNNTGIRRSPVIRIIQDLFRTTHTEENNAPIRLLMYYRVA